jgi:CubicO group peptidase (beta-lactamase class C family)
MRASLRGFAKSFLERLPEDKRSDSKKSGPETSKESEKCQLRRSILAFSLSDADASSSDVASCAAEAEAIQALRAELERRASNDQFSGSVLIARHGRPVFYGAYGYANRELEIPNTLNTKLRFGSMGKMFTGVAVMQLVQSGAVRLDDSLSDYLPDYPNSDVAAVTIHQLLTHTGGAGDIFGPEFDAHRLELKELKDYVELYGKRGLHSPVGEFEYSNYGYILLGRVIEVVSGQSYYDYVRDHIFKPAGMRSTDNLPEEWRIPHLAIPYTRENDSGALQSAEDRLPYRGTSAGGGYSTVRDFLKFVHALTSYRLLNPYYTDLVVTGKVSTPGPVKYAYGFEDLTTPNGVRSFGHGGGNQGINGSLSIFPASGYVVVALANLDPPSALEVEQFIRRQFPVGQP